MLIAVVEELVLAVVIESFRTRLEYFHLLVDGILVDILTVLLLDQLHPLSVRRHLGQLLHEVAILLVQEVHLHGLPLALAIVEQDLRIELVVQDPPLPLRGILRPLVLHEQALDVPLQLEKSRHVAILAKGFVIVRVSCYLLGHGVQILNYYITYEDRLV